MKSTKLSGEAVFKKIAYAKAKLLSREQVPLAKAKSKNFPQVCETRQSKRKVYFASDLSMAGDSYPVILEKHENIATVAMMPLILPATLVDFGVTLAAIPFVLVYNGVEYGATKCKEAFKKK